MMYFAIFYLLLNPLSPGRGKTVAGDHAFNGILTSLPKPGGGEFGKFYSLPALNDPRIGESILFILFYILCPN